MIRFHSFQRFSSSLKIRLSEGRDQTEVIMRSINILKRGFGTVFGAALLFAGASVGMAQDDPGDELEELRSAQREERNEQREYRRNPTRDNYRAWQEAIRDRQREQREYNRAVRVDRREDRQELREDRREVREDRREDRQERRWYRVQRDGQYYRVDSRGAELLRQAVNRGYNQGYRAGMNERRNGRRYSPHNNVMYRNGNFGYATYVDRSQYQYYFREGFERGYEDGFYTRTQYGQRVGTEYNILGGVLNTILNFADAIDDDYDY